MAGKSVIGAKGGTLPQPGMKRPMPPQAGAKRPLPAQAKAYGRKGR
jgi:hypothetical protein